jgi:LysR family transcriptional regulator, glycine cleavage system transcriptional activator
MPNLPLTALRAFEKVAEHLSFTRAAEHLHVSQSAVSQQIALLEERVGNRLLERSGRTLRLTAQGEILAKAASKSFRALERALQQVSREGRALDLKLPPTFAMKWLMPRLPSFQVMHPRLELHINTSVHPVDFESENINIGMQRAAQADSGLHAIAVMDETAMLVCSPGLWKGRPAQLKKTQDWPLWLAQMEQPDFQAANQIEFSFSLLMYQAAIEGLGVCLAQPEFIEDDLASGRLIAPFTTVINTGKKHFIVCPEQHRHDPAVASFLAWVKSSKTLLTTSR